jgi:hypothetical protein
MAEWTFSDGSELRSGGKVSGDGPVAMALRSALTAPEHMVHALPPPAVPERVIRSSDFLLDLLAREIARVLRRGVSTEYEPDFDDAPSELRERLIEGRSRSGLGFYATVY